MHHATDNGGAEQHAAQIEYLNRIAFQSMREASEYGSLVQFIKSTFEASNNQMLLRASFCCVESFGLDCVIQVREVHLGQELSTSFVNDHQLAGNQEDELLAMIRESGRIVDINRRTVFNDKHVSFIVKNMPEDPDDYGRKKDVLAVLLEAFEARLDSIKKQDAMKSVLHELVETVNELNMLFNINSNNMIDVMENLMSDMCRAFNNLALTEEQENHFTGLVDRSIGKLVTIHAEGRDIEDKFTKIVAMAERNLKQ